MLTRIDFRSKPSTSVSQPTRTRNDDSISLPRLVLLLRGVSSSLQCLYVSIPSTFFYSLLTLATRIIGIPRCAFDLSVKVRGRRLISSSASVLQYWFSWIDPDYPHVYRPSLGCRYPWHFSHCWLDDPRRRERDLFCPGKFALIELFHCSKEYDSLTIIRLQDIQAP